MTNLALFFFPLSREFENESPETSAGNDFQENRTAFIPAEADHSDVYDFTHTDRGLALIINNEDFSLSKNFGSRPGSSYDEVALYQTFKKLGFKVLVKRNLTARQMLEALRLGEMLSVVLYIGCKR